MLIGISGKIGSGKDTLASMLLQGIDAPIKIVKFADALKEIVCLLTGCTRQQLESQEFKSTTIGAEWNRSVTDARHYLLIQLWTSQGEDNVNSMSMWDDKTVKLKAIQYGFKFERTYREMLQELGTDVFRKQFHDKTWINATFSKYKPIANSSPRWIITDCRFPDEAEAIKERGGIVIRIERPPTAQELANRRGHVGGYQLHISETALDEYNGFDAVIDNNGTLEELQQKSKELVTKFNLK